MTYLTIASPVLPSTSQSVLELATLERFLKEAPTLCKVDGFANIPVGREGDNVDAAVKAWARLRSEFADDYAEPATFFLMGLMEDAGWERLPNFRFAAEAALSSRARVLQIKSGNSCAPLDGVVLASALLARDPKALVGIVASEKVNSRFVRRRTGSQIFGDAAIAAVLSAAPLTKRLPTMRLMGEPMTYSDPRFFEVRPGSLIQDADFLASARNLCQDAVRSALDNAGLAPGDVTLCCTQNLSERLFKQIDADRPLPGRPLRFREQIAHAPCVDLLANLSLAWAAGRLTRSSVVLTLALGMGIGATAAVFRVD